MDQPQILVLLDVSASMTGNEAAMVDAVNGALLHLQNTTVGTILVSIYLFNSSMWSLVEGISIAKRPILVTSQYKTSGNTALYDAIGRVIDECPDRSTIVIATDGEDTSSITYGASDIRKCIESARTERGIQFMFVAEGDSAMDEGQYIGFKPDTPGVHVFSVPPGAPLSQAIADESFKERLSLLVTCMSQEFN